MIDRVEWRYLKLLLLRFGFDTNWVSMILKYVSSVKYAICINGNNTPSFARERGLRQGDPLSPYLFILCSEWLSYSLSNLEVARNLEGIKISRGAPLVTHLMFADDCLLLFKVAESTADSLSSLLKSYERISRQIVNYNKSELVLSPNVLDSVKNDMQTKLSVKLVGHHDKYLGLPLSLKRQLTLNFSGLIDKFGKRTENWNAKNLSARGKEVLIKAVLQALPQYAMNCFLFPEHIIKKLHSAIRGFWWSGSSNKKPIHWVKAEILCREKEFGGLGFKDLKCINLSFLAKQAWRIYTQPDLLVSKIFKAKYCHDSDMLFCNVGYRPSLCWRSIVKCFDVLRSGATQDINGHLRWTASSDGVFDLKSAYKLMTTALALDSSQTIGCSDYSQLQLFWKAFWKLKVPRKIKIFGSRGFHDSLPTGSSLHKRGMTNNVGCPICGYKIETSAHIFLHCWFARATWTALGLSDLCSLPASASFADIIQFSWRPPLSKNRQLILVSLWLLWHNRNLLKHGENGYSLNEMTYKAINQSRCFEQYESKFLSSMRFLYNSDIKWRKPPVGFIKINYDASWIQGRGGGIGIIARDSDCNILAVKALRTPYSHSSPVCEGLGLLESFKLAESLKADKVIFESDCAKVVNWFNICPDISVAHENWFKESMHILHLHMEWKIFLIRREANVVADQLAKRVTDHNWFWTRLDCCPRLLCLSS